jgi:arylsulfatase A-like enzyme
MRFISALFFFGLLGAAAAEPAGPPNVVIILSDDQAWTDYGFMKHPQIQTPRLDRLAAEGLCFTRGYVTVPLCRPSLASIITGLHAHRHGITGNDPDLPDGANGMAGRKDPKYARFYETIMSNIEKHPTLPRLLAPKGYLSMQSGKWWEGVPARGGFTQGMTHGDPARGARHGDVGLEIGRKGLQPVHDFLAEAKRGKKPFFLWYAPMLPHAPHTAPPGLIEKYRAAAPALPVARYWAMCEFFDRTIGELLDRLDAEGLAENTVVLYLCDNGWIQNPEKNDQFLPRSKQSPSDGGIRTPILVRWPGRIAPRRDDTTPVSSVDLAPTILKACGVEVPAAMPGLDLADAAALAKREAVFGAAYAHNIADVDNPVKSLKYRYVVERTWKLILPNAANVPAGRPELFDLSADPHEKADLAEKNPDRVEAMTRRLETLWAR